VRLGEHGLRFSADLLEFPASRGNERGERGRSVALESLSRVDAWIAAQPEPFPTRPEAIRRLVEKGLAAEGMSAADPASIPVEDLNASNDE
jgi:hypothetical protein